MIDPAQFTTVLALPCVRAFLFSVDLFSMARSLTPQLYVFSLELSVQAVTGVAVKGTRLSSLKGLSPQQP